MRFRGQLLLPDKAGPGLQVALEVADHRLAVVSERERLGAWPLDTVQVRRVGSDTFAMTVAGEPLHFVADDTVSFAYSGIPAIEKVAGTSQSRSPLRTLFGLFRHGSSERSRGDAETAPHPPLSVVEPPPEADDEPTPIEPTPIEPTPIEPALDQPDTDPNGRQAPPDRAELQLDAAPPPVPSAPPEDQLTSEDRATHPPELDPPLDAEVIELIGRDRSPKHEPTADETESQGCPATRIDGLPCRSPIIGPSGYCFPHDPDRPVAQGLRKALEARARLKRKGAAQLTRVYARLDRALKQVEQGELDTDKAIAMAQLARTMCAILELDEERLTDAGEDSPPTP